jgi:hypothetical protein
VVRSTTRIISVSGAGSRRGVSSGRAATVVFLPVSLFRCYVISCSALGCQAWACIHCPC